MLLLSVGRMVVKRTRASLPGVSGSSPTAVEAEAVDAVCSIELAVTSTSVEVEAEVLGCGVVVSSLIFEVSGCSDETLALFLDLLFFHFLLFLPIFAVYCYDERANVRCMESN